jgi:hypothetical protein
VSRPAPLVPEDHPRHLAVASLVLGRALAGLDGNAERKARKRRVLERRLEEIRRTAPDGSALTDVDAVKMDATLDEEHAMTLLVDLAFSDPFAPYEVAFSQRDFIQALRRASDEMRLRRPLLDRVLALKGGAMGAHTRFFSSRWKLAMAGISSAAVLPLLPAFVGAATGAVLAREIALHAARGIAMGGVSLAGGGWLLTGIKSAASSSARAGARQLVSVAPAATIRVEVAKCQTWVVLQVENGAWSKDDAKLELQKLDELEKDVERELAEERALNDPGANRIRELEAKVKAISTGRDWIAQRVGAPRGAQAGAPSPLPANAARDS